MGLRSPGVQEFLEPGLKLLEDIPFWQDQSDGLAVFLAPEVFHYYRLPLSFEELVVVGDRFHLKPLLPLLSGDGRFYVLALSQNEVRLLQGSQYCVDKIELKEVPKSLAETLKYDEPLKQLQYHSGTPSSAGKTKSSVIFHGQGVGADDKDTNILRYFQQINKGISELFESEESPLVLAGVEYLLPIYREANTYPHLVKEGITGNPEVFDEKELHTQAWNIVQPLFLKTQHERYEKYKELVGTGNTAVSNELKEIIPAAYYGRVETLFVSTKKHQWGSFDPDTKEIHLQEKSGQRGEDLLDFAAIQTLLHGGTVYAGEPEKIPDDKGLVAAIFRY
jgi:hypothetical protein